jgi:hypothetical protein
MLLHPHPPVRRRCIDLGQFRVWVHPCNSSIAQQDVTISTLLALFNQT